MNRSETGKILKVMLMTYPKYYKGISNDEFSSLVDVWQNVLEDYSYREASLGLKAFLASDTEGFPPSPGQVIAHIQRVSQEPERTPLDAWSLVRMAVRNSNYNSVEEFEKLPKDVQEAVGHPENLKEWAAMDENTFETVEQSQFIKGFTAVQKRNREYAKIPMSVKQSVEAEKLLKLEEQRTKEHDEKLAAESQKPKAIEQSAKVIPAPDITADSIADELPEVVLKAE